MIKFYIELFEFANNKANEGVEANEIVDFIKRYFDDFGPADRERLYIQVTRTNFLNANGRFFLNQEASMAYLDYLELKEARESSKEAKKDALIALRVSIVSMIIGAFFSAWQIYLAYKSGQ